MDSIAKTKTETVLTVMKVLAWIVFIGLMVKAGAILVAYGVSLISPEAARKLYMGMDLSDLRQSDFFHYTLSVFFRIALPAMESYIAYLVILTISPVNLEQPFTMGVSRKLESMSYDLVAIWAVSLVQAAHSAWWARTDPSPDWGGGETLFMAGLVFVISQIFKRGVELQSENDLTV